MNLSLPFQQADQDAATRLQSWFIAILEHQKDWVRGRDICDLMATKDRVIRQMAANSRGSVISGQRGYRLTKYASTEEIDRAEAWLRSQGRAMIRRSLEIRRSRNQGGKAA